MNVLTFDRDAAVDDSTSELYFVIFKLEIIFNFISILYYIMNVSIDYRTRANTNNVRRIHHFIYFTCPFNSAALIVQKVLIIMDFEEGYNPDTTTFQVIQFVRLVTSFITFICLPALAIERSFATYFHHDYEKKNRSYIGYTVGFLTHIVSIVSVSVCLKLSATFYPFVALVLVNIVSCLVNAVNYRLNQYYYNCSLRKIHSYSLTERYQISENIQFAKSFHIFALTVALFTTICSLLLLLPSYPFTPFQKNIFIALFEALYTIFILCAPYIHYKYNAIWQHEFQKCLKMHSSKCASAQMDRPSVQLNTTFGERMDVGKNVQTDIYFCQLVNSWNVAIP